MSISKNTNLAQKICDVYYTPLKYVNDITVSNNIYNVIFTSGKTWNKFPFTIGSAKYKEIHKHKSAGEIFSQELKIFFPGDDDSNSYNFDTIIDVPMLIKIVYTSKQTKLFGTIQNPVKMFQTLNVGNTTGSTFSFKRTGERLRPLA